MNLDNIRLNISIENTNEIVQAIADHIDKSSISSDNQDSSEANPPPLVVTLADRKTCVARPTKVETIVDVIAIFGLKRISEEYPQYVRTTKPFEYVGKESQRRGNYYVNAHGDDDQIKNLFEKSEFAFERGHFGENALKIR